jgi:hypothetical protein
MSAFALAVGVGVSTGPYAATSEPTNFVPQQQTQWRWDRAWWFNGELSLEGRWQSGFELRGFIGLGSLANPTATSCNRYNVHDQSSAGPALTCDLTASGFLVAYVPYWGISMGYAFDIE